MFPLSMSKTVCLADMFREKKPSSEFEPQTKII